MSIEQLDLLLCDTYQMDAWFPFGWKWKKELEKSSYSVWAIDELKRYIVGRLYPKKNLERLRISSYLLVTSGE